MAPDPSSHGPAYCGPLNSSGEGITVHDTFLWWVKFFSVLAFPFLLVIGVSEAASFVPGTVKVVHWRNASSIVFLLTVLPMGVLLTRSKFQWVARGVLAVPVVVLLLVSAATMQFRPSCGDEPVYIGIKSKSRQVAACG